MSVGQKEVTRPANLHEPHGTGPKRTQLPRYEDRLPPCNAQCPAGENIQAWLAKLRVKDHRGAWEIIMRDNPFPALHGRVCYHTCENVCNRNELDSTVNIHAAERYLGDLALAQQFKVAPGADTGKRVLVIGAGPSGLSAAYHLRRAGHAVVMRDAGRVAGGMMHFGIPKYRLPRETLDAEIQRIIDLGVELHLNDTVTDLESARVGFDAVFLAVGAHLSRRVDIPATDATKILDAVGFLRSVEDEGQSQGQQKPLLGRRVAVYGGGNTAIDSARTAKRLGASEALIVYRRTRERAPAHAFEIAEAEEEGVQLRWLSTIQRFDDSELLIEKMELGPDGWPRPTGELERLSADTLILALGQESDTAFLRNVPGLELTKDGTLAVDGSMMTGVAGIFAGGDMVPADRSVTVAVGHGKKAARHIDVYLAGKPRSVAHKPASADYDKLHVWFRSNAPKREESHAAAAVRVDDFGEVVTGLTEQQAVYEAQRCLSCGNCYECDACLAACPEHAVIKLGPGLRYRFDYDLCTGCAVCNDQCPAGAITMYDEPAQAE